MSEQDITAAVDGMQEIDSLMAHEFAVEIDGERATGIFSVSGFSSFQLDDNGQVTRTPFTIAKMVQRDGNNPFNRWIRETVSAASGSDRPTRGVTLLAIDEGVETRRWALHGATITAISYSDFDSASSELIEERITIMFERLDESFPATR